MAWRALVVCGGLALMPGSADACASCSVGDPTLTTMGVQQPYAGRLRAAAELAARSEWMGSRGEDRVELDEQRLQLSLAWAATDRLMWTLMVPLVARQVRLPNLAQEHFAGLGDAELRGRAVLLRDRALGPSHLLSAVGGLRVPTAPIRESQGQSLPPEQQTGTGSFTPLLGLSYAWFGGAWSAYASEVLLVPLPGRGDFRVGHTFLGTHTLQWQLTPRWALRAGLLLRLDTPAREGGQLEADGGGLAVFSAPALVVSPLQDLVLYAECSLPVLHRTRGDHGEGPVWSLGAAYDFR